MGPAIRLEPGTSWLLLLACGGLAFAQTLGERATPQPVDLFDFWVGDWDLTWANEDGSTGRGRNRIDKILDGAVVEERFEEFAAAGETALKGRSLTVRDKKSGIWRQSWADNQGGFFTLGDAGRWRAPDPDDRGDEDGRQGDRAAHGVPFGVGRCSDLGLGRQRRRRRDLEAPLAHRLQAAQGRPDRAVGQAFGFDETFCLINRALLTASKSSTCPLARSGLRL